MSDNIFTRTIGEFWNDISGVSAQQAFNANEAQKQRDYEERMSNTAYQRAVEDMKKAGLNIGMMYGSGGHNASTPQGTSAQSGFAGGGHTASLMNAAANLMNASKYNGYDKKLTNTAVKLMSKTVKNFRR